MVPHIMAQEFVDKKESPFDEDLGNIWWLIVHTISH